MPATAGQQVFISTSSRRAAIKSLVIRGTKYENTAENKKTLLVMGQNVTLSGNRPAARLVSRATVETEAKAELWGGANNGADSAGMGNLNQTYRNAGLVSIRKVRYRFNHSTTNLAGVAWAHMRMNAGNDEFYARLLNGALSVHFNGNLIERIPPGQQRSGTKYLFAPVPPSTDIGTGLIGFTTDTHVLVDSKKKKLTFSNYKLQGKLYLQY